MQHVPDRTEAHREHRRRAEMAALRWCSASLSPHGHGIFSWLVSAEAELLPSGSDSLPVCRPQSLGSNNHRTTASAGPALSGRPLQPGSNSGGEVGRQEYLR